jgi:hypothetical protein
MNTITATIFNQIKLLDRRAMMAWGARELVAMKDGLKFKTSGMVRWKGYVYIKYDYGQDLYNIDFYRVRNAVIKYDRRLEGVFAEDMVSLIDQVVG